MFLIFQPLYISETHFGNTKPLNQISSLHSGSTKTLAHSLDAYLSVSSQAN